MTVLNYGEESVSIAMEGVEPNAWMDEVYRPDIIGKPEQIYKKPGRARLESELETSVSISQRLDH